jgi:RNA polymerase sigma factor (sigma-70 family)
VTCPRLNVQPLISRIAAVAGSVSLAPDAILIFGGLFAWIGTVSANDGGASGSGIGPTGLRRENGAAVFATTHWSVVLEAQGGSPAAQDALEKLCRTYWRPVYSFIRRQGVGIEEAEDLTQGFFALLLERRDFVAVRKEIGRLRSYLLTSLKHFLASQQRRAMAVKRGKGQYVVALEGVSATERADIEPADPLSADRVYERRWALTLMEQVLRRLKDEYRTAGNAALFDWLKQLLPDEPGAPSRAEIAARLGMTENAVRQALYRFRHRYQVLLREEIGHTVAIASDIEDELRHLIAVLRA